ncbi:hypothetical protein EW145_g7260 [Phellinidium pouzarii]|uniref:RNA exonuclease 4 n=1 Tax=Phellinidium pouzarii TaxID=167371 RepID=A0A4S4KMH2_9AGAM|nr:hypothetical protein EW145_g7260 [Phellinidium pouzarii]
MDMTIKKSKAKEKAKAAVQSPSANWFALQKGLPRKRRKIEDEGGADGTNGGRSTGRRADGDEASSSFPRGRAKTVPTDATGASALSSSNSSGSESLNIFSRMVYGQIEYTESQQQPGKYLALDCEMVGVGIDASESSLARVSLVNYHGAIILDEFVRQRERVVDYRTAISHIVKAKPFMEVQMKVSELLKDRILVGHAVNNDLKALLLSQPRQLIRDTQLCAGKARVLKTKYPALRKLVQQELGVTIQAGEHSSVTDARATMALYRLHQKEWEKGFRSISGLSSKSLTRKRKAPAEDEKDGFDSGSDEGETGVRQTHVVQNPGPKPQPSHAKGKKDRVEFPGGGRLGVSTGLSTVIKSAGKRAKNVKTVSVSSDRRSEGGGEKWWATLGGVSAATTNHNGLKGSMRVS